MRKNRRDTRANVVFTNDCGLPDFDALNVGNRVERTSGEHPNLQPEIRSSRPRVGSSVLSRNERTQQERRSDNFEHDSETGYQQRACLFAPEAYGIAEIATCLL